MWLWRKISPKKEFSVCKAVESFYHAPLPRLRAINSLQHHRHTIMGSLKKRRKTKINKHKRKKRMRANRHKKRLRYKS